jgi:hypothetical protein
VAHGIILKIITRTFDNKAAITLLRCSGIYYVNLPHNNSIGKFVIEYQQIFL